LLEHKPDLIFVQLSVQRNLLVLCLRQNLGIPQLDLYSWDNVESHAFDRNRLLLRLGDLMKEEVLKYTSLSRKSSNSNRNTAV
jgi:hypothetical protein